MFFKEDEKALEECFKEIEQPSEKKFRPKNYLDTSTMYT
jgi:hypothetical protein